MKKIIFMLAPTVLAATTAHADLLPSSVSDSHFYLSTTASYTKTVLKFDSVDADFNDLKHSGITPAFALGYDSGSFRTEINYENLGTLTSKDPAIKGKLKVQNVGITTVYNFIPGSSIQPYLGGRFLFSKFNSDNELTQSLYKQNLKLRSNNFGLGIVTGIEYKIINHFLVGINAKWDLLSRDPAHSLSGGLSLRYKF